MTLCVWHPGIPQRYFIELIGHRSLSRYSPITAHQSHLHGCSLASCSHTRQGPNISLLSYGIFQAKLMCSNPARVGASKYLLCHQLEALVLLTMLQHTTILQSRPLIYVDCAFVCKPKALFLFKCSPCSTCSLYLVEIRTTGNRS